MKGLALFIIKIIALVGCDQIDDGAFREIDGLVKVQPSVDHTAFEGAHGPIVPHRSDLVQPLDAPDAGVAASRSEHFAHGQGSHVREAAG